MKILIIGSKVRIIHLKHFSDELEKLGMECKVILDMDFLEKSLSFNLKKRITTNKKLKNYLVDFLIHGHKVRSHFILFDVFKY